MKYLELKDPSDITEEEFFDQMDRALHNFMQVDKPCVKTLNRRMQKVDKSSIEYVFHKLLKQHQISFSEALSTLDEEDTLDVEYPLSTHLTEANVVLLIKRQPGNPHMTTLGRQLITYLAQKVNQYIHVRICTTPVVLNL